MVLPRLPLSAKVAAPLTGSCLLFNRHIVYDRRVEVHEIVSTLQEHGISQRVLASLLGVSRRTITEWVSGRAKPRKPLVEHLEEILRTRRAGISTLTSLTTVPNASFGVRDLFSELREIFHRRSRFSSVNEATDVIASLMFVHTVSSASGGRGLKEPLLTLGPASETARTLLVFCERILHDAGFSEKLVSALRPQLRDHENALSEEILCTFARLPEDDSLSATDTMHEIFSNWLRSNFVDEKELGQYLTPPEIVSFAVNLALRNLSDKESQQLFTNDPKFGLVGDPSCGVGSFLLEYLNVCSKSPNLRGGSADEWVEQQLQSSVVAIDRSERMLRLCAMNLAIKGFHISRMIDGDALTPDADYDPAQFDNRFGMIFTNPPFGARAHHPQIPNRTIPSEVAFIYQYLQWLRPGGQLVAVIPDSVLTNTGIFQRVRSAMANEAIILNIVSLPHDAFAYAGTNTKTSILHLKKGNDSRNRCAFWVCDSLGYSVVTRASQRLKVPNGENQLEEILDQATKSIKRRPHERTIRDVDRWDAKYQIQAKTEIVPLSLIERVETPLSELLELRDDRVKPSKLGTEIFNYIEISDLPRTTLRAASQIVPCAHAPSRARQQVRRGDILLSTVRPERGACAVVFSDQDGYICSSGIAVLTPKEGIDPMRVAAALRDPDFISKLSGIASGVAYPAFQPEVLMCLSLVVPMQRLLDAGTLDRFESVTRQLETEYENLFSEVRSGSRAATPRYPTN